MVTQFIPNGVEIHRWQGIDVWNYNTTCLLSNK